MFIEIISQINFPPESKTESYRAQDETINEVKLILKVVSCCEYYGHLEQLIKFMAHRNI